MKPASSRMVKEVRGHVPRRTFLRKCGLESSASYLQLCKVSPLLMSGADGDSWMETSQDVGSRPAGPQVALVSHGWLQNLALCVKEGH